MKNKLKNFWYYYKWHTIIALLCAFTIAVSVAQCALKTKYDYSLVLVLNDRAVTDKQASLLADGLKSFGEDVNGDGKINVFIMNCSYDENSADKNNVLAIKQKLQMSAMGSAECILYITDDASFEFCDSVKKDGGFFINKHLPDKNGKALNIADYAFIREFNSLFYNPVEPLYISERIVKGTIIERNISVKKYVNTSEKLLNNIIAHRNS